MKRWLFSLFLTSVFMLTATTFAWTAYDPFASSVIDISLNAPNYPAYLPAPGQWVNKLYPVFNDPNKALGPIQGGGTNDQNNDDIVSLGRLGGQIVLAFDHDVQDCPANPMGLDAIVFSNAVWVLLSPQLHFAELATIEIMPELNGNDIPGDAQGERWFLIPGSHLTGPSDYRTITWDRSDPCLSGYPAPFFFPDWPDSYQTGAHELTPTYETVASLRMVLRNPNEFTDPNVEGYWGYAEYTPSLKIGDRNGDNNSAGTGDCCDMPPELFYTVPDDPFTTGITPGSGGGDAFDIAWAVDPDTWQPAALQSFRYIRITAAVDDQDTDGDNSLEEISAEIDGIADVRPVGDVDGDGDVDHIDVALFSATWLSEWGQPAFNPAADFVVDNKIDLNDYARFAWAWHRCVTGQP